MDYLAPFSVLKDSIKLLSVKGQLKVDVNYEDFLGILKRVLLAVPVDESWYRETYPDVDEAIKDGVYTDAKQHFIENGYFEGRRPCNVAVDEEWYLATYPDVRSSMENGDCDSGQDHFNRHGYTEGRLPGAL
jgi:hypothetical protein